MTVPLPVADAVSDGALVPLRDVDTAPLLDRVIDTADTVVDTDVEDVTLRVRDVVVVAVTAAVCDGVGAPLDDRLVVSVRDGVLDTVLLSVTDFVVVGDRLRVAGERVSVAVLLALARDAVAVDVTVRDADDVTG